MGTDGSSSVRVFGRAKTSKGCWGDAGGWGRLLRLIAEREEHGPTFGRGLDPDPAPVTLDDALDHDQGDGPPVWSMPPIWSMPIVQALDGARQRCRRAPGRADEVGEGQPQEARISVGRQSWGNRARDIAPGMAGPEPLGHSPSERREVHPLALELTAREARQLDEPLHELLHAAIRRGQAIEPAASFSVELETVVNDERLAEVIHAPQRPAQVMRHGMRERIHLLTQDGDIGFLSGHLGLEGGRLRLGRPLWRDVHDAHLDHEPGALLQAPRGEAHASQVAITPPKPKLFLDGQRPSIETLDDTVEVGPRLEELADVPRLDLLIRAKAGQAPEGLIAHEHLAVPEGVHDARDIGVEEGPIAALRFPSRLLRLPRPRQRGIDGIR